MTDKINKGEDKVSFCPTHDMLGEFLLKPLEGTLFTRMREKILNLPTNKNAVMHRSVLENQQIILKESKNNEERAKCKEEEKNQYVN